MIGALRAALTQTLGSEIKRVVGVTGGDINDAFEVELKDARHLFVKTHPNSPRGMFTTEARGLRWLSQADVIRLPKVVHVAESNDGTPAFLVLEWLAPARRVRDFDEQLGRSLAHLHRMTAPSFGLDHDNFIGRLAQDNTPAPSWVEFYWSRRLQPQVKAAKDRGLLDSSTVRAFDRLHTVLAERVGPDEPPSRLHGDLWGGNLHVDEKGAPCLIDPAAYGGHREVDLAMMRLFGGFGERVFAAYEEAAPLARGAEERVALYQLYPLLVHVNLFGRSYVSRVSEALSSLV